MLASLSPDNYRLLGDLVAPDKPRDAGLSFGDIVQKMKAHTAPETSSQLARYEFDHLARSPGERVADSVARVKHLVACKFTAGERPARLKDRFISGLQDSKMVSAILRQKCEDIMFSTAVETAAAVERTLRDVRAIAGPNHPGCFTVTVLDLSRSWSCVRRGTAHRVYSGHLTRAP